MQDPVKFIAAYQHELFQRLNEFFTRATGTTASDFSTIDTFGDTVHSNAHKLASRSEAAFRWMDEELLWGGADCGFSGLRGSWRTLAQTSFVSLAGSED